jgi:putative transcriptional regulator
MANINAMSTSVVGNRIRIILAEKDKKSTWLANKLGMSENMISRYVTNRSQPSLEVSYRIAEVLGVQMEDLVKLREE